MFKPLRLLTKDGWTWCQTKKEFKKALKNKASCTIEENIPSRNVRRGTIFDDDDTEQTGNLVSAETTVFDYSKYYGRHSQYTRTYVPKPPYIPVSYKDSGKIPQLLNDTQIAVMQEICQRPIEKFNQPEWIMKVNDGARYFYLDRGSKVLAVAHLDYVCQTKKFVYEINNENEEIVWCPQLDDRLGAWVILEHLFNDFKYDILLTENEEMGRSTAEYFNEKPEGYYNWIFEFDRKGSDLVMYSYEDEKTRKMMKDYGFTIGRGSYSDISRLENLGCKAFNFGVGYEDYHSPDSHAKIKDTLDMCESFKNFFKHLHKKHLPHTKVKYAYPVHSQFLFYDDKGKELSDEEWYKKYFENNSF